MTEKKLLSRREAMQGGLSVLAASVAALLGVKPAQAVSVPPNAENITTPYFEITGVPTSVSKTTLSKWANETANGRSIAAGDVEHINTIGQKTEMIVAEPGCYVTHGYNKETTTAGTEIVWDIKDVEGGSAYLITPDTQRPFTHDNFPFPLIEGGFALITGGYMDLVIPGGQGNNINVHLPAEKGVTYNVIVRGADRDYKIDEDPNKIIFSSKHNPAYTLGTIIPPGQFVSQNYFLQNVNAAHGVTNSKLAAINCGTDGCTTVKALMIDSKTGAYTFIEQRGAGAQWTQLATNIK